MQKTLSDYVGDCACCGLRDAGVSTDYCVGCVHRGCHLDGPTIERSCWTEATHVKG